MPEAILVELTARLRRHPWWTARARFILSLLGSLHIGPPATVLDAGCGWGTNLEALERAAYLVTGLDSSREALKRLDSPRRTLIECDLCQAFPTEAPVYDAVIAMDVLEHLDDDKAALRRLSERTKPNGALIVSVPALPELFSHFDEVQGHRRRYTPESLKELIAAADLQADRVFFWGQSLIPLIRSSRKRRAPAHFSEAEAYAYYTRLPLWPAPLLLRALLSWENARALGGRAHTGSSLFAVVRRRQSARM
ncbi:MAG TPA: class I SAM-dependent methyltransferase [Planctomycetota bacterium]|jgi:SAM-dependent methyltransferase